MDFRLAASGAALSLLLLVVVAAEGKLLIKRGEWVLGSGSVDVRGNGAAFSSECGIGRAYGCWLLRWCLSR